MVREQLSLPFVRHQRPFEREPERAAAQRLADSLQSLVGQPVRLAVTDNRSSIITVRQEDDALVCRVHHMFLDANERVCRALADYALGRRRRTSGRIIDDYIEQHRDRIRFDPAASPAAPVDPQGEVHDLQAMFDRLNGNYFDTAIVARIGWGRRSPRRRRRRSIRMGSYLHEARLIRIHPALDRRHVPEYYVEWVVYHEMLHQVVVPRRTGGRLAFHPPEFRRRERLFSMAAQAQAWEEMHFELLLRD